MTDQTSAHDALGGLRAGRDRASPTRSSCARALPDEYVSAASMRSMADHVRAMLAFQRAGAVVFDYGNNLRAQAQEAGVDDAFDYPGFVPAFIRPQFCEGRGPFRWAALSGRPGRHRRGPTGRSSSSSPTTPGLRRWIEMAQARVPFQGLPARICWLGLRRAGPGRARVQRARPDAARSARRSSSGATTSTRARSRHPTARPRRWRRLRRRRRLAAAQRAGQHGGRGDVGLDPPRRRGRDRLLPARRDGRRRRRHARSPPRSWSAS